MSKVDFNINAWRKKHVLNEGVGGVVSKNPFAKIDMGFRTEAVDHIDDKEAATSYDNLGDKDLDNDGDHDASDKYLHKRQGKVAQVTENDCDICEDDDMFEQGMSDEESMDGIMHDAPDRYSESFNIKEWQKRFYGNKRNLKWG